MELRKNRDDMLAAEIQAAGLKERLNRAFAAVDENNPLQAIQDLKVILDEKPDTHSALLVMAKAQALLGDEDEVKRLLEKTLRLAGDNPDKQFEVAIVFAETGDEGRAEQLYRKLIKRFPRHVTARINLSNLMDKRGDSQGAVDVISEVIEIDPNNANAYVNLGRFLAHATMFEEAEICYRQAMQLAPEIPHTYINYGSMLHDMGKPEEAIELYQEALTRSPGNAKALWNLALSLLGSGHIEQGWDIYGFGFEAGIRKPLRTFPGLIWRGEDLEDKTIFLWREQGLGDDFRFATVYHDVVARAGHVIIETDPRIVPLYQRTWPTATVRAETHLCTGHDNYGEVDFDLTAPGAMPSTLFRRSLDDFPKNPPFLVACPEKRAEARRWLDSLGGKPKIGITWRSGISNALRDLHATELADWAEFLNDDRFDFVNLQYAKPEQELAEARKKLGITIHEMPGLDTHADLEGVAALLCELDLTVGAWNAATELAGALGVQGILFAPAGNANQLGTGALPWYPTMTVYPQVPFWDRKALATHIHQEAARRLVG